MGRGKVLFVTNWYPTNEQPLRAPWVREHARAVRLYDDVAVLHCGEAGSELGRPYQMELRVDEAPEGRIPTYRVSYRSSAIPGVSYLTYVSVLWRAYRRVVEDGFRPDVIHAHVYDSGVPALLIGRWHGLPVLISEHFSSFPRKSLGRIDVLKAWLAFRWADRVLPVSHALQRAIEDYGIRARFHVIPNVVDMVLFFPPRTPRQPRDPKRLLFVGQLEPVKAVPCLLRALSHLAERRHDWHLDIVGEGRERIACERLTEELGIHDRVTFHGRKSKAEVAEWMRRADLFVLPSLCETFSVPVAEALATGTPVLATRCGGPEELVADDVGRLIVPEDVAGLCDALDDMLDHLRLYSPARISRYATERFSPQLVGGELHDLYRSLRR
ncbi:MAG TPA: glycosyltransferase [Candidatus Binatia bacterium]|nr:glycosyltransferase [Candidatus Binatia bacterium]